MISGVLQRLTIIELTDMRLVLRELPLLEWFTAGVMIMIAANMAIFGLWLTTAVAAIVGISFVLQARMRCIIFDAAANSLEIQFHYPLKQQIILQRPLGEIIRAYLHKDHDGSTQIILVDVTGEHMGLSVYSRDPRPWKDAIVIAINAVLHQVHKDAVDPTL